MVVVRRRWFQAPWEFRESALFTAVAVVMGFVLQFEGSGTGVPQAHLPFNAIFLGLFALIVISAGFSFRENTTVKWLGGIPLGLCLIVAIALLSFLGGVLPQGEVTPADLYQQLRIAPIFSGASSDQLKQMTSIYLQSRINQIFSSWPFAVVVLLFLVNLGLSLSWKLIPFKVQNIQFILFHAGFWIALSCGIFGSSDLQRLVVPVEEGKACNLGYTMESDTPRPLPFSVFLHDFSLEEYPPQLLLYDPHSDRLLMDKSKATLEVRKGTTASWNGVEVLVLDYMPAALPGETGIPQPADRSTGIPYAKVRITTGATQREAWISTGSPGLRPDAAQLGNLYLIMVPGTPKSFRSAVTVQDTQGNAVMANLEVNKPVNFKEWKLYQMGYDEKAGRWSKLSLIEVIRDPWLPTVYLGFFMIMAGNILFFWTGIKRKEGAA